MNKFRTLHQAAFAAILATSVTSVLAADTFRNGESFYGQPAVGAASARVVDVQNTKYADITYGETVVFRGAGGNEFAWTFNGLGGRSWELTKFAPAGFASQDYRVYVSRNPLYRR